MQTCSRRRKWMHQLQWKWKRITGPECQLLRGLATMLAASRRALHVLPRRVCRSAGSVRLNHAGPSADSNTNKTTHFGFKTVAEQEKQGMVKNVFDSVASNYDLMNDAMSLGVHRLWKDDFVSGLNPGKRGPMRCLDVAGGTGDIALRILDHAREKYADRETVVEVSDINAEMLKEGYRRFKKTMYHNSAFPLFEASAS
jgi:2-methoxy-6-polyprenyl-1,4-benzoquinol methylase